MTGRQEIAPLCRFAETRRFFSSSRHRVVSSSFLGFALIAAAATLFTATTCRSATIPVGTYVCNPGAQVRVPVVLDSARGLVGVSVTLAYDPQVAVCSRVEPGNLDAVFDDEFLVANEGDGTVTASMFKLGQNVAEDIGGTVATFVFLARNGTAGEFSDVTVTKVELLEESGVRDVTVNNPVSTKNGMIRVMASDASTARMEEVQTVVADSRLGSLALSAGDGIQASDAGTPIIVDGSVTAPESVVPVAAPDHGWATAIYTLLKTPTSGLAFSSSTNASDRLAVTETRANGISTYELVVASVDGLAVLSLDDDLDASLQAYVRECVGRPAGINTVWVEGGVDAVSMARAFGIRPGVLLFDDYAEATFAMPTVRCTGIDVKHSTVTAVVEPAPGNTIAGDGKVRGIVELMGRRDLADLPSAIQGAVIDTSHYFDPETKGAVGATATFGDNHFFQICIRDE